MNLNRPLYTLLSEILNVQSETVTDETSPENTPGWDSFNALMMVAELEKASGVQFTMEDVMSVKNVGDIKKMLHKYNIEYEC